MAQVPTVTGSIDTAELGPTLMHEHVFVLSPEIIQNYGDTYWDAEERIADAVSKLNDLASRGIRSIVDPTVIGLGRYLPWVQRVAEQIELQIVAATGLYTYNDVPFFFHYRGLLFDTDPDPMVTFFVKDITEGIAETGVKAGIIKCATDADGLTPGVERVLRACARTHRETGVPITTHTDAGSFRGRDQQRVFAEEGVDLSRVVIGHSGDSQDLDYLRELMDKGSMIGMDRFGIDVYLPTSDRVQVVADLCAQGYADRMVLAHDAACYMDWFTPELIETMTPNWHFNHISDDVLPALVDRGVTQDQIDQMLVGNPRRLFEMTGAY
ncbi:MAG: phosphotriesterase-related protein [Acidimicrobiales bacterium]